MLMNLFREKSHMTLWSCLVAFLTCVVDVRFITSEFASLTKVRHNSRQLVLGEVDKGTFRIQPDVPMYYHIFI